VSALIWFKRFGQTKIGELADFSFIAKTASSTGQRQTWKKQFPPDAVFSGGKWIKGEKVVSKK